MPETATYRNIRQREASCETLLPYKSWNRFHLFAAMNLSTICPFS